MKILVACADYPSENGRALQFVHVRNKYYIENGIDVEVLNFACNEGYIYEEIKVFTEDEIKNKSTIYDVLICHAPNLRNHYKFIKTFGKKIKKKIFFFHGHEIVKINKVYPKPYKFANFSRIKYLLQNIYDCIKLIIWRRYLKREGSNDFLIFVSNSLKKDFSIYIKIDQDIVSNRYAVINNSVSKVFEEKTFNNACEKLYDYITIRSDIDNSVYCMDLLSKIATLNPEKKFLIIGKGEYFTYNIKPDNIIHINCTMKQEKLLRYINQSKCALMPTRRDSQGVMSCELATFGIPLITSNLPVCHEMFDEFENVRLLSEDEIIDTNRYKEVELIDKEKCTKFYVKNTVFREIKLIRNFIEMEQK